MVDLAHMVDRMRILHLLYLRFWSAIAWHALTMAEALEARGHACWIAGAAGTPILTRTAAVGLRKAELDLPWLRPWNWLGSIHRLHRFLTTHQIDAIFVHTGSGHLEMHFARQGTRAALIRVRADARVPRGRPGQRWLYRTATDHIVASGAYILDHYLHGFGIAPERQGHVPPGIDLAAIRGDASLERAAARAQICARHQLGAGEPLIGIIGRLSPVKGHADLIRALGIMARAGKPGVLLVVGAEKQVSSDDLRRLAQEEGVADRVHFTGWVPDPLRYAAALDVGVIASLGSEAVSRSALEFMAVGVPVIATRVGILPEVVGRAEQLVAPAAPAELAAALERLVVHPNLARELGEAGRVRAAHDFSLEKLGERAEAAARAAISTVRGHPGDY